MMILFAQYGLIISLTCFLVLHIFIIFKIIPYKMVWGGRLKTDKEMVRFEAVSIVMNILFIGIILAQADFLKIGLSPKCITIALWLMTGIFLLNTLGNAASKNKIEKYIFTPATIVLAIFSLILALAN